MCEKDCRRPSGNKESNQAECIYERPRRDQQPASPPDSSLEPCVGIEGQRKKERDSARYQHGEDKAAQPEHWGTLYAYDLQNGVDQSSKLQFGAPIALRVSPALDGSSHPSPDP